HPLVQVSTIHSFCWSLLSGFQKQLRSHVAEMGSWTEKLEEAGGVQDRLIEYNLGFRFITDDILSLHHDDVIPLTIAFMENAKFRAILAARFPIILIDEYQDTDANWAAAIQAHFLEQDAGPQFGFFGDHWQKIYGDGCGEISHPSVKEIGKNANFRSRQTIINKLNLIRPELPQFGEDPNSTGEVVIYHTNNWVGTRRGGGHWNGDLPAEDARAAYEKTVSLLEIAGWNFAVDETKVLMLTHRVLAAEQGYPNIVATFRYRDDWYIPEHPHLKFFKDRLEPARLAFEQKRFGEMMEAFSTRMPIVRGAADKSRWSEMMTDVVSQEASATVGELVDFIRATGTPPLPDDVIKLENALSAFDADAGEEMDRRLVELQALRSVAYSEVQALVRYLNGHSPFETKHGVKGREFDNVLAVFGRGWNQYNFGQMLEWASTGVPANKQATFERNRNLFYVCCSRAKTRLGLLFTQELSPSALATLEAWFGAEAIRSLEF
ncbi:MAG: UvrD-helicase domain-containing protein, partial [Blastomonas sp.]